VNIIYLPKVFFKISREDKEKDEKFLEFLNPFGAARPKYFLLFSAHQCSFWN